MPVRKFNGVDEVVETAIGGADPMTNITYVFFAKLEEIKNIFFFSTGASNSHFPGIFTEMTLYFGGQSLAISASELKDVWCLFVYTKTAGTTFPRMHLYRFDTEKWLHENGSVEHGDGLSTKGTPFFRLGKWGNPEDLKGLLAVGAIWEEAKSDAEVEELASVSALTEWLTKGEPKALWFFDQSSVEEKVKDRTEGGADENGRIGTTVVAEEPPIPYEAGGGESPWDLLAQGLFNAGAWSSETTYDPYEIVSHKGASYLAIKTGKGKEPPSAEFWDLLAGKGEPGPSELKVNDDITWLDGETIKGEIDSFYEAGKTHRLAIECEGTKSKAELEVVGKDTGLLGEAKVAVQVGGLSGPVLNAAGESMFLRLSPFRETTDFGLVAALPGSPVKGDRCFYEAAVGVVWSLIYDGVGEFPWKTIGGPPLHASQLSKSGTRAIASWGGLVGGGINPSITAPLKGDYDVRFGSRIGGPGTAARAAVSISIDGSTAASSEAESRGDIGADSGHAVSPARSIRKEGLVASKAVALVYISYDSATFEFRYRWLELDPVRVG